MITLASIYQLHSVTKENGGRVKAPNLIFMQALSGTQLSAKKSSC